ncbi:MAG: hypothetical protein EOP10_24035 [Proteobacteria bacterium]|nr:MAG: hypothetical protein EOP10_24035 [Pseudomonadota bacterium]
MMLSFSRGRITKAVDGSSHPSAALSFVWEGDFPTLSGKTLVRLSDGLYRYDHADLGPIFLSKQPWWTDLPLIRGERGLWMSFQGFSEGVWCDGIFGRWAEGRWVDLILPGPSFEWGLSRSTLAIEDVSEFWSEEKFLAQKLSLIEAVRLVFASTGVVPIYLKRMDCDVQFLMHMFLVRLAFPLRSIQVFPADPSWKRLAQNLNISVLKSEPSIPAAACIDLGPKEKLLELIHWQQSKSPFIPINLFTSLSV